MIKTIVLDLDGPILDGKYRHYACYSKILTAHGYTPLGIEAYWKMKRERKNRRKQLAASGAEKIYIEFFTEWLALIEQPEMLSLDQVQSGVQSRLEQWRQDGKTLILATMRRYPDRLQEQIKKYRLNTFFSYVVACDHNMGGVGKAQLVKNIYPHLRPEESLWIGDTEKDNDAAHYLGCKFIALSCGLRTYAFLASLSPDFLYRDLTEVDIRRIDVSISVLCQELSSQ